MALIYVASVFGAALLLKSDAAWDLAYLLRVSSTVLSFYTLLVLAISYVGWRWLWRMIPSLGKIYPDLSGSWDASITWNRAGKSGTLQARAVIKQNLFRISMELEAPDSDSRTLSAVPKKDAESGRADLHYIYLVTPHAKPGTPAVFYHGAAILTVSDGTSPKVSGNYWTSHQSDGRLALTQRS